MSLCKDLATIANDHLDQLQSHLEHYKVELVKDKDLKESIGAPTHSKGKGHSTHCSHATIKNKVAANSDSEAESIKIVIDNETTKVSKPLKFTKTKGNEAAVSEKHKEPSKSFPLPSAREYLYCGAKGVREQCVASALGLTSIYAGEGGTLPSIDSLCKSHKRSTVGTLMVERPEHLAKLKSALMGDVIMLQHTLYTVEKRCHACSMSKHCKRHEKKQGH
ncbi:hypothetical protein ARMSODRAFT_982560 [Armillaria solidipes]|uniref:Uncharacterized protein n=1 Tax=Armillaria solidipes TaxID=1076256 RepID=A0A2H3AR44_9AGAR|nr:hypothetical protein ARMSODRAFT_982560 [Armillaria solidipes]